GGRFFQRRTRRSRLRMPPVGKYPAIPPLSKPNGVLESKRAKHARASVERVSDTRELADRPGKMRVLAAPKAWAAMTCQIYSPSCLVLRHFLRCCWCWYSAGATAYSIGLQVLCWEGIGPSRYCSGLTSRGLREHLFLLALPRLMNKDRLCRGLTCDRS